MTELKFYLLCFIIAAPQGALGSAAEEFVEKWVDRRTYYSSIFREDFLRTTNSDECFSKAAAVGAQAVQLQSSNYCYLNYLTHPVCTKSKGDVHVYVRKDFLTDGSPNDNATYDVAALQSMVPGGVIRSFRIESPTIIEFEDLRRKHASWAESFQYFATTFNGHTLVHSDRPAMTDPSCYTTSACSYVFLTTAPEIPASELLVLYNICGQSIQVDSGKSVYVLSHEGIGCKNFPNDYPVSDCWAEFTGAGEITLNVTLVNFRESDQCDGFTMTAVTDDANGSSTTTDLCDATAPTELTSTGGKVRIEFGGRASPTREKYGFDIHVTAA